MEYGGKTGVRISPPPP